MKSYPIFKYFDPYIATNKFLENYISLKDLINNMSILMSKLTEDKLKNLISELYWYHTIEFPNGMVSKGVFNHRLFLKYYGFPESLKKKNVLDVGASDGFFSFEFERRGAQSILAIDTNRYDGSVAIDPSPSKKDKYILKYSRYKKLCKKFPEILDLLDLPGLNQLLIAKDLLRSNVNFRYLSIYDLNLLREKYDLVFCGDLIQHLKSPLLALENLFSVTKKLCIISLSSSLSKIRAPLSIIKRILNIFRLCGNIIEPSYIVKYVGNSAGGSFFHFHPYSFREALLASGFKKVKIYAEFNLPNLRRGTKYPNTIFHCEV